MSNFIKTKKQDGKIIIELNNPPVNAENIKMLSEIYDVVKQVDNSIIIITGHQVTSKGRHIFSAGGDLDELKQGKTLDIAKLINSISSCLNDSSNYVVSIICGDAIGGGWGMPFDFSDKIYFVKGSSLIAGFTRNKITPGCGLSLLIRTLSPKTAYKVVLSEEPFKFSKLQEKDSKIFKEFESRDDVSDIVKKIKKGQKRAPHLARGKKLKGKDKLAMLINELVDNPRDFNNIQLKYLKMSLSRND